MKWGGKLLPALFVVLSFFLLASSVRTFEALRAQKEVYLRSRAASIAGRLETFRNGENDKAIIDTVLEDEPGLLGLQLIRHSDRIPGLEPIWNGDELFRTAVLNGTFRTWVPFHADDGMRVARIDLALPSADFLVVEARHNLLFASLASMAMVLIAWYWVWTTRRRAKLEHLAELGKMSAVLAHEIRNPLGAIKGFAQLIGEKLDQSEKPFADTIVSETVRLENLVNDLLRYGRPPEPHFRLVEWFEIEERLRAHAARMAPARITFSGESVYWQTDPDLLVEALLNLMRNAVEAAGEDGEVRVEVKRHPVRGFCISVNDNGPGIPEKLRNKVMEPFFTTKSMGTGLGLAITDKIAGILGGKLQLRSRSPSGVEAELIWHGMHINH